MRRWRKQARYAWQGKANFETACFFTIRVKTCRFCLGVHYFRPGNELTRGKPRQGGNWKTRLKTL